MSNEKIIMDKVDYHKILNRLCDIPECDNEIMDCIDDVKDLLDKAEPYERMNNTMSDSTYRSILRFLDHISKYSETTSIDYDIIEIKVLLKQLEIDGDK